MDSLKLPEADRISPDRLPRLRDAAGAGPVLILTHDNPDPDALATGKALAALLLGWGISSRLVYSGLVARAENRAMLNILTPEWEHIEELRDLDRYSAVALVDTQPGAGNNSLPSDHLPQIVLDHHHPLREGLKQVPFVDVRPEVGASVSLVYQYLEAAGIELDPVLATAMFYGLQTDTRGLARSGSFIDEVAYVNLLAHLDRKMLIEVEQAGLSRDYYRAFCDGLQAARIYNQVIVANLGKMHRPDLAAEMADLFIRMEGARAVLCLGQHDTTLYFSLRTEPTGEDAGLLVQRIIVPAGKAGGHGSVAGGQVPVVNQDAPRLMAEIEGRFLEVMGETGPGESLLGD